MKYLIILRHAAAESNGTDLNRNLTPAGIRDARAAGRDLEVFLSRQKIPYPDLILSSPAVRALQTVRFIRDILTLPDSIVRIEENLYLPSLNPCLEMIWACGDKESLLVCSHNPGMTSLAGYLFHWNGVLPPCGFVLGRLDIQDWKDLAPEKSELILTGDSSPFL